MQIEIRPRPKAFTAGKSCARFQSWPAGPVSGSFQLSRNRIESLVGDFRIFGLVAPSAQIKSGRVSPLSVIIWGTTEVTFFKGWLSRLFGHAGKSCSGQLEQLADLSLTLRIKKDHLDGLGLLSRRKLATANIDL
jgi:hypothetical protein